MNTRGRSENQRTSIGAVYRDAVEVLKNNPTVLILFLFIAFIDLVALFLLWLAPSEPVSFLLAPIIKTFWSSDFLHYPANFLLLPKLFSHAHFLILSIFGLIVTGITIKKIDAYLEGESLSISGAIGPVLSKYLALLVTWLVSYAVFTYGLKSLAGFAPNVFWIQMALGFILAVVIQSLFSFLIPAIMLSGKGFFKSLWLGFCAGAKHFFKISLIIAVPIFAVAMLSLAKAFVPHFITFNPELTLWVLVAGIFVTMVVDYFITATTAILYIQVRKNS